MSALVIGKQPAPTEGGTFSAAWIGPKWKRCGEEMPPVDKVVMVYDDDAWSGDDDMSFARWERDYLGRTRWIACAGISGHEWDFDLNPTHWAERPEPPR